MSRQSSVTSVFFRIVLPLLILAGGFSILWLASQLKPAPRKEESTTGPPRVETVAIRPYDRLMTIDVDGTVVPFREITLTSEVSGRIELKSERCRAGNYLERGTVLFQIDPLDYELEVRRLSKELQHAEILVNQIDIELENTQSLMKLADEDLGLQQREVARLQQLANSGAASSSELDRARRTEVATRNTLRTLTNQTRLMATRRAAQQASLELAATSLEKAELDLKRTKILAPLDGVIVSELIEEDSYVQRGTELVVIEDTSAVEVRCNLRMEQLYWLWESAGVAERLADARTLPRDYQIPKAAATIVYRLAGRDFAWQGQLARYEGIGLNTRTRTVPCRIVVENPRAGRLLRGGGVDSSDPIVPPALVRGMFVEVALQVDPRAHLASVPLRALRPGNVIWKVADGRLQIKQVRVARLTDDVALLETANAPFQIGDRVVTTPLPSPRDGMLVEELQPLVADETRALPSEFEEVAGSDITQRGADAMKSIVKWAVHNTPAMNTLMIGVLLLGGASMLMLNGRCFRSLSWRSFSSRFPIPGPVRRKSRRESARRLRRPCDRSTGIKKQTSVAREGAGFLVSGTGNLRRCAKDASMRCAPRSIGSPVSRSWPKTPKSNRSRFANRRSRVGVIGTGFDRTGRRTRTARGDRRGSRRPAGAAVGVAGQHPGQPSLPDRRGNPRKPIAGVRSDAAAGRPDRPRSENIELPGGSMKTDTEEILLRGKNKQTDGRRDRQDSAGHAGRRRRAHGRRPGNRRGTRSRTSPRSIASTGYRTGRFGRSDPQRGPAADGRRGQKYVARHTICLPGLRSRRGAIGRSMYGTA